MKLLDRFLIKWNKNTGGNVAQNTENPVLSTSSAALSAPQPDTEFDPDDENNPVASTSFAALYAPLPDTESDPDDEDINEESGLKSSSSIAKSTKRIQKFRMIWLENFKWMEKKKGANGVDAAFCRYCQTYLVNNKNHLIRHEITNQHAKKVLALKNQPEINNSAQQGAFIRKAQQIKIAEMKIIMFLLQHNLPFILVTPLICLIKAKI